MSQSSHEYEKVPLSELVGERSYGLQAPWREMGRADTLAKANIGTLTELLFVLLPIVAMIIVFASQGDPLKVFQQAEWSFAAAVLAGQSIVRVATAVTLYDKAFEDENRDWATEARRSTFVRLGHIVGLIVAVVIVLLLVPSLVILSLMLILSPTPSWLLTAQILLFLGATLVYASSNVLITRIGEPKADWFDLELDEVS